MKIELEGHEALQHLNAIRTLRGLGYRIVKNDWVSSCNATDPVVSKAAERKAVPVCDQEQVETYSAPLGAFIHGTGVINKADCTLQADIEALKQAQAATDNRLNQQADESKETVSLLCDRLAAVELAITPVAYLPHQLTAQQKRAVQHFNRSVSQQIKEELQPGGLLYGLKK